MKTMKMRTEPYTVHQAEDRLDQIEEVSPIHLPEVCTICTGREARSYSAQSTAFDSAPQDLVLEKAPSDSKVRSRFPSELFAARPNGTPSSECEALPSSDVNVSGGNWGAHDDVGRAVLR